MVIFVVVFTVVVVVIFVVVFKVVVVVLSFSHNPLSSTSSIGIGARSSS